MMITLSEASLSPLPLPRRHRLSSGAFSATFGMARKAAPPPIRHLMARRWSRYPISVKPNFNARAVANDTGWPLSGHGNLRLDFPRYEQAPDRDPAIRQERIRNDAIDLYRAASS